jgi:hypothetical protein
MSDIGQGTNLNKLLVLCEVNELKQQQKAGITS